MNSKIFHLEILRFNRSRDKIKIFLFITNCHPTVRSPLFAYPIASNTSPEQLSHKIPTTLYSVMQKRFQIENLDMTRAISLVT